MSFLSRFFPGGSAIEKTSAGSAQYPERPFMHSGHSPLLEHGEKFLSVALNALGIQAVPTSCLSAATSAAVQAESREGLWKQLVAEAVKRTGEWNSQALSLAHALWMLCSPLKGYPYPSRNPVLEKLVASRVADRLRLMGYKLSVHNDGTFLQGHAGYVRFGLHSPAFVGPNESSYVELAVDITLGRFDELTPRPPDWHIFPLCDMADTIIYNAVPMLASRGDLLATPRMVCSVADPSAIDSIVETWLAEFHRCLSVANDFIDRRQEHDPGPILPANAVTSPIPSITSQAAANFGTTEEQGDFLLSLAQERQLRGVIVKDGKCYMQWGRTLCPLQVRGPVCMLLVPITGNFENLVSAAFTLNSRSMFGTMKDPVAGTRTVPGAWAVEHDDRFLEEWQGWDMAFVARGDTRSKRFLIEAADEASVQLRRLSQMFYTDHSPSYVELFKQAHCSQSVPPSRFISNFHLNLPRNNRDAGLTAEEAAQRKNRLAKREQLIRSGTAALYAGNAQLALRCIEEAESIEAGEDVHMAKTFALLCSGNYGEALLAAAPLYNKNKVDLIVMVGTAHLLQGDAHLAERHFRRAVDLLDA